MRQLLIGRLPVAAVALASVALAACESSPNGPPPKVCAGPGTICPFAGNGDPAFTGEAEPVLETSLYEPIDLEFAPDGRAYILDWQNHRVRRVDTDGRLRTVFGTDSIGDGPPEGGGNEAVAPGVLATTVNLNHPTDLQFSPDGATMMLAAWHNHKVRKMDVATDLEDIVCGAGPGFAGDGSSDAKALLNRPKGIALAPSGDLYILDANNLRIRRIAAASGEIDTVAGSGMRGSGGDGGPPLAAQFSFQMAGDNPEPGGSIALDAEGRVYVADTENDRVRRIDFASNLIETIAGTGTHGASGDGGPATAAELYHPRDIEISPDGRLFIADTENHKVRAVDLTTGIITTVAGTGTPGATGDGGDALQASFDRPYGIAFDAAGNLYIADTLNNVIRKVVQP
jgi:DNA-binding beta-propeller fold protein YncE